MRVAWAVALVLGVASAAACFGGDSKRASTPTPADASPTDEPQAPGATATPAPPFEVSELRVIDDIALPDNWNLVYASAGHGHGTGLIQVHRTYRSGGEPRTETMWEEFGNGTQIRSAAASPSGAPIVLSVCRGEDCGWESGPKPNATTEFMQSDDFGVTWREIDERPGEWWIGWVEGRVLAMNPDKWDAVEGNLIEPLDGSAPYRVKDDLNWDETATIDLPLPAGAARLDGARSFYDGALGRERHFARVWVETGTEQSPRSNEYFAEFDSFGKLKQVFGPFDTSGKVGSAFGIRPVAVLWDNQMLVIADYVRQANCTAAGTKSGNAYAVLDLRGGTLAFIEDFVLTTPAEPCGWMPGGAIVPLAFQWGNHLWRVNTPGSCLNLRRSYGEESEIVGCAAHGSLLKGAGPARDVGGTIWGAFTGPWREEGSWAALEFVERDD